MTLPSTTSDRTTDPSPADVVARLREAATSIRDDGTPAQVGMTAEECDDAADLITALQTRITALQTRAETAERERDEAYEMADAHEKKWRSLTVHETCACSYDHPEDVCMHHSPQLASAEAEAANLRKRVEMLDETLRDTLSSLEYWYRRGNPEYDGEASSTSVIGRARALANKETENV